LTFLQGRKNDKKHVSAHNISYNKLICVKECEYQLINIGPIQSIQDILEVFDYDSEKCKTVISYLLPEMCSVLSSGDADSNHTKEHVDIALKWEGYSANLLEILSFRKNSWLDNTLVDWYMDYRLQNDTNYDPKNNMGDPLITICYEYQGKCF